MPVAVIGILVTGSAGTVGIQLEYYAGNWRLNYNGGQQVIGDCNEENWEHLFLTYSQSRTPRTKVFLNGALAISGAYNPGTNHDAFKVAVNRGETGYFTGRAAYAALYERCVEDNMIKNIMYRPLSAKTKILWPLWVDGTDIAGSYGGTAVGSPTVNSDGPPVYL